MRNTEMVVVGLGPISIASVMCSEARIDIRKSFLPSITTHFTPPRLDSSPQIVSSSLLRCFSGCSSLLM